MIGSPLLLLLEGDEEATFWVLVVLLRNLPPQFYARAPLPLLGFWTEVEVLTQLASRILGLSGVRDALLQAAPRWSNARLCAHALAIRLHASTPLPPHCNSRHNHKMMSSPPCRA